MKITVLSINDYFDPKNENTYFYLLTYQIFLAFLFKYLQEVTYQKISQIGPTDVEMFKIKKNCIYSFLETTQRQ